MTTASGLPSRPVPFTLATARAYATRYAAMAVHPVCYAPVNLLAWADVLRIEVRFAENLAWLSYDLPDGTHAVAPAGDWRNTDWSALESELLSVGRFDSVTEPLLALWRERLSCRIEARERRDAWEYLCDAAELAASRGGAWRMQRNNEHAYAREHGEPDVRELGPSDVPAMLALSREWLAAGSGQDTGENAGEGAGEGAIDPVGRLTEVEAMRRALAHWEAFELAALGLFLEDRLAAFTVCAPLDSGTMGVLYAKAAPKVRGAAHVMLRATARAMEGRCRFLNLAEDMGLEGLRFFKTRCNPAGFVKLYTVTLSRD